MKTVVFDCEADNLLDEATQVWCGVCKDVETEVVDSFTCIKPLLIALDSCDVIITHGGTNYDWPLLKKLYGYEFKGYKVDTLLMSRLQRPNRTLPVHCVNRRAGAHSVEAWGWRVGMGKKEIANEEWGVYSPKILERCQVDVEIQHLILQALVKEGEGENWKAAHRLTLDLFTNLQRQAAYGWLVNQEWLNDSITQLEKWIAKIDKSIERELPYVCRHDEAKLKGEYSWVRKPFKKDGSYSAIAWTFVNNHCGARPVVVGPFSRVSFSKVNLGSNGEVKDFLLKSGWVPGEYNHNSEGEQTSPKLSLLDDFVGIQGSLGKLIVKRVQCIHRKSVLEGWKENIRPDGRLPSTVQGLTVTARARHSGIVNVPRGTSFFGKRMRGCFVCRPSWRLVGADAKSCQMRMLAARMNDPEFQDVVLAGDHHKVIQEIMGIKDRDTSKTFFYAIIFGAGNTKTGKIVGGDAKRGEYLKNKLFNQLPRMPALVEELAKEWRPTAKHFFNKKLDKMEMRDGYLIGIDGRRIQTSTEHKVLVNMLQSDESIMMSHAYNMMHNTFDKMGLTFGKEYGTVCWMHDEFQIECEPVLADRIGEVMCESIKEAGELLKISCPQAGSYAIGQSWSNTH